MMNQLFDSISYIISYRESSNERKQALLFILPRIRQYFPKIEILIIEQDSEPKLILEEGLNIRQLFLYNPGLFNKSWSFNYAVKNTKKEIFVFADADIFLDRAYYIKCFEAANYFEAITPNKKEILNVAIDLNDKNPIQLLNKRKLYNFAGGMLVLTRKAFEKVGAWDERFEGWGGEDDAMSHVIYNLLSSKTFCFPNYHIDHPHDFHAGNNQPNYKSNKALVSEITTRNGPSLDLYIHQIKAIDNGNSEKYNPSNIPQSFSNPKFVLAITTFNGLDYLKKCVETFLQTRNSAFSWQLIIADDNSTDGTKEYISKLQVKHDVIFVQNNRSHIYYKVNTILKELSNMTFDLCFKCDDNVQFLQKGWDNLYWETIKRTSYEHLVFYDKKWAPHTKLSRPIRFGNLVSNCLPDQIQGAFYTLTKNVIEKVGYIDEQQFGSCELGHVDFSFRCCRAGFNVLVNPFDVEKSNDFLQLQDRGTYNSTLTSTKRSNLNPKEILVSKNQLLKMDRIYIPYNENIQSTDLKDEDQISELKSPINKKYSTPSYQKADATFYPERGFSGFLGFLVKKIYNLSIDLRINFIPRGIIYIGKLLNKISIHLLNIKD